MSKSTSKFFSILFTAVLSLAISACSDDASNNQASSSENEASLAKDKNHSKKTEIKWAGDIYEREYSPSMGPDNAKVTIVEFLDPACGACRAFYPLVKEILKRHPNDVRLVLRYAAFHEGSEEVVRLLEIAKQQGIYLTILEAIINKQDEWVAHHKPNLDKVWEIAEQAGMDVGSAKVQLYSERMNSLIKQETDDLRALQIRQTPTFFVNKQGLEKFGARELYDLVTKEIEK